MDIDVSVRLAHLGITVPSLEELGRQGFPGFETEGEEALDWWRRLRAVSEQTGLWPVLLDYHAGALASGGPAESGEIPVIDDPAPDVLDKELEHWPAGTGTERVDGTGTERVDGTGTERVDGTGTERVDGFRLPFERWTQEPKPVMVALLPAARGWQVPSLIGYGGWNSCPPSDAHAAILERWHERYGAELVCLTRTGLELGVSRPPATRREALALAWDYASYCHDGVDAIYQADTLAGLAAGLIDANVVRCWWD